MNRIASPDLKTRIVKFSNGVIKDASLKIPAEEYSIVDAAQLIRESFLDYMFSSGGLMSDEVLTSSIGQAHFFEGALGGYKQRLDPEVFAALERYLNSEFSMALDVVRYREPGLKDADLYERAMQNRVLSDDDRRALRVVRDAYRRGDL